MMDKLLKSKKHEKTVKLEDLIGEDIQLGNHVVKYKPLVQIETIKSPLNNNVEEKAVSPWESGRRYMTQAGFRVRSKAEKIIADYLTKNGVRFVYEPVLHIGNQIVRPDFYLIDYDVPFEHFGLDNEAYLRAAANKIQRYQEAGIRFIYTTFRDETDLEDAIVDRIASMVLTN